MSGDDELLRLPLADASGSKVVVFGEGSPSAAAEDHGSWIAVASRDIRVFDTEGQVRFEVPGVPGASVSALATNGGFLAAARGASLDIVHVVSADDRVLQIEVPGAIVALSSYEDSFVMLVRRGDALELRRLERGPGAGLEDFVLGPALLVSQDDRLQHETLEADVASVLAEVPSDLLEERAGSKSLRRSSAALGGTALAALTALERSAEYEPRAVARWGDRVAVLVGDALVVAQVDAAGALSDVRVLRGVAQSRVSLGPRAVVIYTPGSQVEPVVIPVEGIERWTHGFQAVSR
jgi:hypothetical protein